MNVLKKILVAAALSAVSSVVIAEAAAPVAAKPEVPVAAPATPAAAPATATPAAATPAPAGTVAAKSADAAKAAPKSTDGSLPGYTPMPAAADVGVPLPEQKDFQDQYTENGDYAKSLNNNILLPIIIFISLFVLALLFFVIIRFRRNANPVPSKTTHNTLIEVLWTGIPVIILLVIAYPSLTLLGRQFEPAPKNAVTIKATGYQWYWGYTYPDHGDFEVVSNMLPEAGEGAKGERTRTDKDGPKLMAVDNRMVVPAGVPLRIQTTGADVIHAFAIPSLWFKLDAVPGRLNEKSLTITKPGVYFGQCSELCGIKHGFMPIAIEALPMDKFAAWVRAQGGTMPNEKAAPAPAAPAPAAKPAAAAPVSATPAVPAAVSVK
jgi:cytochrome c oxidase subunit II